MNKIINKIVSRMARWDSYSDSRSSNFLVNDGLSRYNHKMISSRNNLQSSLESIYKKIEANSEDKEQLIHLFLIHLSAIHAKMAENYHLFLLQWAKGLVATGHRTAAIEYENHAAAELSHHLWHRKDLRTLVNLYNAKFDIRLDVDHIIRISNVDCVKQYKVLCGEIIKGKEAYLSAAEIYESGDVALNVLPEVFNFCLDHAGGDLHNCLSVAKAHQDVYKIETRENIANMFSRIAIRPEKLAKLVQVGQTSLYIYSSSVVSALNLAELSMRISSVQMEELKFI